MQKQLGIEPLSSWQKELTLVVGLRWFDMNDLQLFLKTCCDHLRPVEGRDWDLEPSWYSSFSSGWFCIRAWQRKYTLVCPSSTCWRTHLDHQCKVLGTWILYQGLRPYMSDLQPLPQDLLWYLADAAINVMDPESNNLTSSKVETVLQSNWILQIVSDYGIELLTDSSNLPRIFNHVESHGA